MTPAQLFTVISDPNTTCKDLAIAHAVKKWVETGDIGTVGKFLDLIYGDTKKAGEIASQSKVKEIETEVKPEDYVLSFDPSLKDV
jgi:Neuraminidase (sialidase)